MYEQPSFINNEFQKTYKFTSMLNPISELELDHKTETMYLFLYLLLYIKDHKSDLLHNISDLVE